MARSRPFRCVHTRDRVRIDKKLTGGPPAHRGQPAHRRSRQENAGFTLNMAMTGSLEPHQAVMHHGTANEVVVACALNSEMCYENVRLLLDIDAHDYKSSLLDIFIY